MILPFFKKAAQEALVNRSDMNGKKEALRFPSAIPGRAESGVRDE